jgi:hypothetical protein
VLPPPHQNGAPLDAHRAPDGLSLDSLDVAALSALTPLQLAALSQRLAALLASISVAQFQHASAQADAKSTAGSSPGADADRILDADAIARELGQSRRWVFRNARKIPCIRRISRKSLAAPAAQVRRWRDLQRP